MAKTGLWLRVAEVVHETDDALWFVLCRVDGEPLRYESGRFLTVGTPSERDGHAARCYSSVQK